VLTYNEQEIMTSAEDLKPNLLQQAFVSVMQARERLYSGLAELLKSYHLTEQQYNVLRIIRGAGPNGLPCLQIGHRMINRLPDITRLLDRLEKRGLVTRARSANDRRVVVATLTEEGVKLLKSLDGPVIKTHLSQFAGLTQSELVDIVRLMDGIAK
jgi:DNA-binding MarR family transcriptional regulator